MTMQLTRPDHPQARPRRGSIDAYMVVRNEAERLPFLLEHHRRLGIDRFFVCDNDSRDGSMEFLLSQGDCVVYHTADSFGEAGCGMNCPFCATGQAGLTRNMSAAEIIEQVVRANAAIRAGELGPAEHADERVTNIVFMGMGEPLANYNRVMQAVRTMVDKDHGLGMSARGVTVSTVGLVPAINKLAAEDIPVTFALSLHAPDDHLRDEMIPINSRWKVDEALDAARGYFEKTGRRVSIEYALIKDMNDHAWRADLLATKLNERGRGWVHVNPIPLNPTPGSVWTASDKEVQREFVRRLSEAGIPTTLRDTRGKEIDGACGQLVATEEDRAVAASVPVD